MELYEKLTRFDSADSSYRLKKNLVAYNRIVNAHKLY